MKVQKLILILIIITIAVLLFLIVFPEGRRQASDRLQGISGYTFFSTVSTSSAIAVGNGASTDILGRNTARVWALIVNDSANVCYLHLGDDKAATLNSGIRLNASGGSFEIDLFSNPYIGAIRGLCATATSTVTVTEK